MTALATPHANPKTIASPAPAGEAPSEARRRGASSPEGCASSPSRADPLHPDPSPAPLTPALLTDILNPHITPAGLCVMHKLTLAQLDELIHGDEFAHATARLERIAQTRARAIAVNARAKHLADLTDLAAAAQVNASDIDELHASRDAKLAHARARHLETARKALTKLITLANKALDPADSAPTSRDREGAGSPKSPGGRVPTPSLHPSSPDTPGAMVPAPPGP